mmetsp:Transcript_37924/g.111075  ORF Transcript_37924/g.111075 Transcript_37924/m.111075 type:complete len:95 (-) Transcript_37924:101-385(-)
MQLPSALCHAQLGWVSALSQATAGGNDGSGSGGLGGGGEGNVGADGDPGGGCDGGVEHVLLHPFTVPLLSQCHCKPARLQSAGTSPQYDVSSQG